MSMKRILEIAQACHEAHRTYCSLIGDSSIPEWDDAPDWQQNSMISGVQHFLEYPSVTPLEMHENWMSQKIKEGWVHGTTKDPSVKQHPCMVPFVELPSLQQFKDYLFITVCRTFLRVYG